MLTGKEVLDKHYDKLCKMFKFRGSADFDLDEYIASGMAEGVAYNFQLALEYGDDEMNPAVVGFWRNYGKGLKKELHNPESHARRWASYIPLSAELPENADRKYPVIFVNHGGKTTLMETEAYGFTHLAAEEECIVIIPENMLEWNFLSILLEIVETMPVDQSRVYFTGFSSGAFRSISFAYQYPEVVAATFCGGIEPFSCFRPHWVASPGNNFEEPLGIARVKFHPDRMPTMSIAEKFPDSVYEYARKMHVPYMNYVGTTEPPEHLPFYHAVPASNRPFYKQPEYILDQLNELMRTNNCEEINVFDFYDCEKSEDLVIRKIGMPLQNTRVENIGGADRYFGDAVSRDGVPRCRFVGTENAPHQADLNMAKIAWDYMKHFSRDPVTHESIYTA
ncbi:MAG: hypothetical protein IJH77_04080 [Mogibacterium sp.]|nr:hypothetical protein [Mogibacterium sp.]